jgi:hypothetical protein
MGAVSQEGESHVRLVRLDDLPHRPGVLKIDVEGHEASVLAGAAVLLTETRPIVFLSTHGEDREVACRALLGAHGYSLERLGLGEWVARPQSSEAKEHVAESTIVFSEAHQPSARIDQ